MIVIHVVGVDILAEIVRIQDTKEVSEVEKQGADGIADLRHEVDQGVDPGLKRDQGVREGPVVEVVAEVPENLDRQPPRKEGVDLVTGRDPHHESVLHLERGNDLHLLRRERIRGQHHVRGRDRHQETREDLLLAESQHLVIERGQLLRRRDQYHLKLLMDARVAEVVAKLILCWWLPL